MSGGNRQEEEDRQRLWTEGSTRGRAAALGAANLLKDWPGGGGGSRGDLVPAILAGCVFTMALVLLVLVTFIAAYGSHDTCRLMRKTPYRGDNAKTANVYFLKHENRTWTSKELCNVETAARRYPEYNIFLINLEAKRRRPEIRNGTFLDHLIDYYSLSKRNDENDSESRMRYGLSDLSNVLNVDIAVDKFFAGSIMSKKIGKLNREKIELAAKFQAIWDSPGVALDPLNVHQLESVRHLFNDQSDLVAGVQIDSDLQASSSACQSFVGHVIREMAKTSNANLPERQTMLKHALVHFCSNLTDCTGVQIIQPIAARPRNFTNCPIIESMIKSGVNDKNLILSS